MFQRILLLNRNRIGDCLFTTPAIRALRVAYPEAVMVAAVPAVNHDLLECNPCLSEVMIRPLRGVTEQIRLLREIRRREFDLVISFQEKSFFYAALARFSGARMTVSLQHWRTRPFYDRIVPVVPGRHEVEKYHAIAQAVLGPGTAPGDRFPRVAKSRSPREGDGYALSALLRPGAMELHVSPQHRAQAEAKLVRLGVGQDDDLVGINPGATMEVKRWPVERFAAVGREIALEYGAQVVILGGPGDEERAAAIAAATPRAVSVAGRLRLGETAALLRRCRLLVSGDTGPLHMAVALGIPTVGLFGPTNPRKYGPWGEEGIGNRGTTVLRHDRPCPECDRPCVHSISAEECLAAAERWLQRSGGSVRIAVAESGGAPRNRV
jgi:ADP-heptose:LPS heptosyltransferase